MTVEEWPLERIREKDVIKPQKSYDGRVMFPSSHDITPANLDACMTVIGNLLGAGNEILIVSKPRFECIDRICREFQAASDLCCSTATGAGFTVRTLYTTTGQELFIFKRPIIFNGISDLVTKHDFADRALVVTLPPIRAESRRPMSEIKREWQTLRPYALGALCDAIVEALRNYDHVHLDRAPRMADFAKWVVAAEPALPWERGQFMVEYEKNRLELIEVAIESDPISLSVMEMMNRLEGNKWTGTPTGLLKELAGYVPNNGARKKNWPQAPNIFTNRLRRVQTFLRAKGIEVEHTKSGKRRITLKMWSQGA
ncbi:hypothetical protein [Desulfosarcina widdelii]|uniref:hypothetical protein n=1 Tax=Desulfosarcina widdelii TaxID=947919 RepID=UPI0012D2C4AD|nr:hypothetical protein [Desulfosarcina widdelii]